MKHNLLITASALAALTALSAPAQAARTLAPNYTFADGTKGYAFATPGEIVPCVYVGFVALGEGRGFPAPTLNLGNARSPLIHLEPSAGNSYGLIFAFGGGGGTGRLASPPAPIRGLSHLSFDTGSRARPHVVDLNFQITGPGDVNSWAAFNPQPDPPGFWFAQKFGFGVVGDPDVQFQIAVNGVAQEYHLASVPEPASWALMIAGFGLSGSAIRRRRQTLRFAPA